MNSREKGFLLLTGHLGNPERKPLTVAQFRDLARRVTQMEKPQSADELCPQDLTSIGYTKDSAQKIVALLEETELLENYLHKAKKNECHPITRVSEGYPLKVRHALGLEAPGVLWAKGDRSLLDGPMIALVGSRDLCEENEAFAREVGKQAAMQGFTLVSGNARGADKIAQDSCLASGGKVISVVADVLENHTIYNNVLYLSEDDYDVPFSPQRALKRNRIIHALGLKTFVAGCRLEKGGTWEGTKTNLCHRYSPVFCFADGSEGSLALQQLGAKLISIEQLCNMDALQPDTISFMDQ